MTIKQECIRSHESMELSFLLLDLPKQQDLLMEWLCSETWPFHVNAQLSQDIVSSWIQTGIFIGTDHQTFWIVTPSEHVGLIRLYELDDEMTGIPFSICGFELHTGGRE
jgi:hypothetical protein